MSHRSLFKGKKFSKESTPLSNSSSRITSASRTPIRNTEDSDDEEGDEREQLEYLKLEELLREKLTSLQNTEIETSKEDRISVGDRRQHTANLLNETRIQSKATTITDIIVSLSFSRTDVSSHSRELLLAQLYKLIVSKPIIVANEENIGTNNYVDEDKVNKVINMFVVGDYRSNIEFEYLFKSVIALVCSDIEDFGSLVTNEFYTYINKLLVEPATSIITNQNKAYIISGYVSLILVLHHGSSEFGIDDRILVLMDIAEGYTASSTALKKQVETGDREHATFITDKNMDKRLINEANSKVAEEALVSVTALHGIGCLLTLLPKGNFLNEFVQDLMIRLIPLLDNDENRDIAKAAGRTIAVIYEKYDYSLEEDEEDGGAQFDEDYNVNSPYYEQEQLFAILERLLNLSSKKVSKKDKKEVNSVFRNISNTVRTYVDPSKRELVYKGTPEGLQLQSSTIDSSSIKLSKYKTLRINTWYSYIRLKHLRWCFSFGLHSQLLVNESIRDILKTPDNEYQYGSTSQADFFEDIADEDHAVVNEYFEYRNSVNEKSRKEKRKKDRLAKLGDQFGELSMA